jgi:AcrR family transcriptional regulator
MARARTSPRKVPRQARAESTVDAILTGAERVLVRDGYDRATTNKIAEEAGVSIGSLYQYFPGKEAVMVALVQRFIQRIAAELHRIVGEVPEDAELGAIVRRVVRALVDVHLRDAELARALLVQVPRKGEHVDGIVDVSTVLVRAMLERRAADLRPKNLELAARLLTTSIRGMLLHELCTNSASLATSEEFVDEVAEMVVRYLVETPVSGPA